MHIYTNRFDFSVHQRGKQHLTQLKTQTKRKKKTRNRVDCQRSGEKNRKNTRTQGANFRGMSSLLSYEHYKIKQ